MAQLTIRIHNDAVPESCGLCGQPLVAADGLAIHLEADSAPICRKCGKAQAPSLAALLDLAEVAQKAGRVARHTLVPSLETLLDLARAAENYTFASEFLRQAA